MSLLFLSVWCFIPVLFLFNVARPHFVNCTFMTAAPCATTEHAGMAMPTDVYILVCAYERRPAWQQEGIHIHCMLGHHC